MVLPGPSIFGFWGKARATSETGPSWHPLVYHSLDVAAVSAELIARDRGRLSRIAAAAGMPADALQAALPFLLSLHDIGKYARVFQAKSPAHWPADVLGPYREIPPGRNHVDTGFEMLCEFADDEPDASLFEAVLPEWRASHRKILFRALAGHHGRPPKEALNDGTRSALDKRDVCDVCITAARSHIRAMHALLRPGALPRRSEKELTILAVGLAGLFVLADWIGSSETWFPYAPPQFDDATLRIYWDRAQGLAAAAVDMAGIAPANVARFAGLARLFPDITNLSPVQAFAETAPLPDGPSLTIVEDVTGSGKTEAALTLAHRLMAAGRANGLYVALPTEATANAMYARLAESFRRLFADEASPSLVLAHGRSKFHDGFQSSIVAAAADENARNGTRGARDGERPSSAECADWIADDRRKAFLASVGAGTVDQALLAILPVKHQSLRLWGLADRVLIVDEAHAYDAYMTRELETLLEFHAALGGSAIILSATLPQEVRVRLTQAFRSGAWAGRGDAVALRATEYPLVTIVGAETVTEAPQQIRSGLARFVTATRVDNLDAALARVVAAARAGACVAFVRNSVDEAIDACGRLGALGLEPLLFHARFAMCDRQRIEMQVMKRFGRDSLPDARRGKVLVATQVIESSLDLDFDLMVTDLAPIDLIIQRAGRLWRHELRPRPIDGPELVVLSGEPIDDPDREWAARAICRGARVYPDHALLWRSGRALFRAGGIATPDGMRALVEAVYDESSREPAPPALAPSETRQEGEDHSATSIADMNVLSLRRKGGHQFPGYQHGNGAWNPDVRTPTRLSDGSVRIRLGRFVEGVVRPWADADSPWRAWALSEVSIRKGRIAAEDATDPAIATAVAATKANWPEYEQNVPLIVLRPEGENEWSGSAFDAGGVIVHIGYSNKRGLCFI